MRQMVLRSALGLAAAAWLVGAGWGTAVAAPRAGIGGPGAAVLAETAPSPPAAADSISETEGRIRRVVIGLVAVAGVTAALGIGFAVHTSPRRRVARRQPPDEAPIEVDR